MAQITKSQLVDLLKSTTAETLTIKSRKEHKMNKTNNPFYHKEGRSWVADNFVEKESISEFDFGGASYEQRVNEKLAENGIEGKFESAPLSWGNWLVNGRVIENGQKLYVRCYVKHDSKPIVNYYVDGTPASATQLASIKEFTAEKSVSAKQANEGLLEESQQVIPNNIDFDNIVEITFDGTTYTLA